MIKGYKIGYLKQDIAAGIITALVSIPISMGYAQVAGLPPVYGLYGSLLPIFFFGIITTSPRFVFGVDAAPTALVGAALTTLGIVPESGEALQIIPLITLLTACWLLVFFLLGAGKFVKFISAPVMGGFITGIGCTIILMQLPKLYGGSAGTGEFFGLVLNIGITTAKSFHVFSFILGFATIIIMYCGRKWIPQVPMSIFLMLAGAILTMIFHIERYGVTLLPEVAAGLPFFVIPDFQLLEENTRELLAQSASIALVIMSETLLFSNSYALRYDEKISNQREILAYAIGNIASALIGCTPVSGSVSRTSIASQFGVKSQIMSLFATITMGIILLFGTGFIGYLPVPVLTGIVIAALGSTLEFDLARKLRKADRIEWMIFCVVFIAVLLFGSIYGVITGVLLSFIIVIARASAPPRSWIGCISNQDGFYALERTRDASPIAQTIIYRFTGSLFFANIGQFQEDIENAIKEDTKQVIVDASGIGNIDVTAAHRLLLLYKKLKEKKIKFYIAEHVGTINDQLRTFDAGELIQRGVVKYTITQALEEAGVHKPYALESIMNQEQGNAIKQMAEFEWAFGSDADAKMEEMASVLAKVIVEEKALDVDTIREIEEMAAKGYWDMEDEDEFLDVLEMRMAILQTKKILKEEQSEEMNEKIWKRHMLLETQLSRKNMEAIMRIRKQRHRRQQTLKKENPEAFKKFRTERRRYKEIVEKENPELAKKLYDTKEEK